MTRPKILIAALLLLALLPMPAAAQDAAPIEHTLASTHLGQERTFSVQLPSSKNTCTALAIERLSASR